MTTVNPKTSPGSPPKVGGVRGGMDKYGLFTILLPPLTPPDPGGEEVFGITEQHLIDASIKCCSI